MQQHVLMRETTMKKIKRWIAVCCLLFAATLIPVDAQEAFIIDDLHVSMEVHEMKLLQM